MSALERMRKCRNGMAVSMRPEFDLRLAELEKDHASEIARLKAALGCIAARQCNGEPMDANDMADRAQRALDGA